MIEPEDIFLREVLEAWRADERRGIPSFEHVWTGAEGRVMQRPRSHLGRLIAWGGLVAAAATVLLFVARGVRRPPTVPLFAWRSPTAFLLSSSSTDPLFGSVPRPSASVIDIHLGGPARVWVLP